MTINLSESERQALTHNASIADPMPIIRLYAENMCCTWLITHRDIKSKDTLRGVYFYKDSIVDDIALTPADYSMIHINMGEPIIKDKEFVATGPLSSFIANHKKIS